jgi:hypothetical protein
MMWVVLGILVMWWIVTNDDSLDPPSRGKVT